MKKQVVTVVLAVSIATSPLQVYAGNPFDVYVKYEQKMENWQQDKMKEALEKLKLVIKEQVKENDIKTAIDLQLQAPDVTKMNKETYLMYLNVLTKDIDKKVDQNKKEMAAVKDEIARSKYSILWFKNILGGGQE